MEPESRRARPASGRVREPVRVEVRPLTRERWPDLLALFTDRGAYEGCWCMYFRQPGREHWASLGDGNRRKLKAIVDGGRVPGLLAFDGDRPVGWCSVAPREEYARVMRSPLRPREPEEEEGVWSVVCFFIPAGYRRRGVATQLLDAAVEHAAAHGAKVIEAYPFDTRGGRRASTDIYTGTAAMFADAGFEEHARRFPTRPVMRRRV
jgi:GNAT superfamily N-acetyltransferase